MYLGYVKAGRLDETDQLYKSKLEVLKVQKVFSDSKYDTTALKELLGYVRQGDSIVVESILDLSISAGEFIELAIKLNDLGEPLVNSGVEIVINISGFGTNTKFRVVNSTGQERWINYDELCKKLDEGKIVGASRGIHGNIVVHKGCDKQCTFEGK